MSKIFYFATPMKKIARSFITFTRPERNGLIVVLTIIVLLLIIRFSMHLWFHPNLNRGQEEKLLNRWKNFRQHQAAFRDSVYKRSQLPLNINTADSVSLVHLKGIGPVTAARIIQYRTANGPFKDIDQIRPLGHFTNAAFDTLKKHLTVSAP